MEKYWFCNDIMFGAVAAVISRLSCVARVDAAPVVAGAVAVLSARPISGQDLANFC
ncbi:hypothetical protein KKF05_02960 [Patescibacteria group bacterium]|nr:hypothetical protein [Patescibacteria group bacterium]MBU1028600.1 hypothetical protein [Patescibacteria group bacterium]MBU1915847.1 hypothetical protein [Patescibacteria group bacterium]